MDPSAQVGVAAVVMALLAVLVIDAERLIAEMRRLREGGVRGASPSPAPQLFSAPPAEAPPAPLAPPVIVTTAEHEHDPYVYGVRQQVGRHGMEEFEMQACRVCSTPMGERRVDS